MAADWPALNALAWLRLPCCGAEHPTRVEDFVGNDCVIGSPIAPHTQPVRPMRPKEGFFLGWVADGKGAVELPVVLVEHTLEPRLTWTVRGIGDPVETQRRNFVRLAYETEILLYLIEHGAPTKAMTLDVSEGGLRCEVDSWAIDPGGRIFTVEVPFDGKMLFLKAQVAWWGNLGVNDRRTVGLRFIDVEPKTADAVRGYIFAAQLAERRRRMT